MLLKKLTLFCLLSMLSFAFLYAQDVEKKPEYGWNNEGIGNLNFTQNQFDNWSQGGEDSWSWQLDINAKFINNQEKYNWSNTAKVSYGKTKVGSSSAKKAADEIKLESVYTRKFGPIINPYAAVTGLTQFTDGFVYNDDGTKTKVSGFLDPGYFTQSIGVEIKPNEQLKTRLGAAAKETITKTQVAANTYADGEKPRVEYGAESVTDAEFKFNEILLYTSKLELFSTLNRFDEIDVTWDNLFSAKVTKYITASLNIKLFYDKDISAKRQLKQTLAVGLSYTLF
jgi:hypothetical protein